MTPINTTLTPEQYDKLCENSTKLQESFMEELNMLSTMDDPKSTEFKLQLDIVNLRKDMLVQLNEAIKLGLNIQFKPKHTTDENNTTQEAK